MPKMSKIKETLRSISFIKTGFIHFVAPAHIVGWVGRDAGTIHVGFAYLSAPQQFEIAIKLANPIRPGGLNPTYY